MIITKLKGGIGNQMFQYAMGRSLSLLWEEPFAMNTTYFNSSRLYPYPYVLDKFNILNNISDVVPEHTINEKYPGLDISVFVYPHLQGVKLYDGYWQDQGYFNNIRNVLLREFTLKEEELKKVQHDFLFENDNTVFVHVRRGERVSEKSANKVHGLVSMDYYEKAIDMMNHWFPSAYMIGLSDDPVWTEKNLGHRLDYVLNAYTDYQTMHIMSRCSHAVIANSSFSWWGAWLINNPDKIIIAPSKWTIDSSHSNVNIVPGWIRLDPEF